jgi:hypothetical protein
MCKAIRNHVINFICKRIIFMRLVLIGKIRVGLLTVLCTVKKYKI